MRTEILRVPVDVVTLSGAVERLLLFFNEPKYHIFVTPNPEMIMLAQRDETLMQILREADLVAPDGIGVVLASKLSKYPIRSRVPGCDAIFNLLKEMSLTGHTAYFLGASPGVAARAKIKIENQFSGVRIIGVHDGYFNSNEEKIICDEISQKRPDLLVLGLSMGMGEKWAYAHRNLPVRVVACVGGTLDVMAGHVTRAPAMFQKLGLEWFYRLLRQPKRAFRMLRLPLFAFKVIAEKIKDIT